MKSQQKLKGVTFMTGKSICNFLSELRKEKGITQKELADFLNVSDKTVSHWECDKYSPDISVIPVLAEFFGVTCDEILRGERKLREKSENISDTTETDYSDTAEDADSEIPYNNDREPLDEEREYARYARIRLHNAFSKRKFINVLAIFVAIVLWAVSYTVIQLIEHKIGLHNFELYATIGTAFFSAAVGAIIIFSSHLKFISMVNMCPFVEAEFLKWRRMAKSILPVPLAILVLMCIIAYIMFVPITNMDISQSETMFVPGSLEAELPQEVDPSVVLPDESVASIPTSNISDSDPSVSYITGEDLLTSNP
jgi:transcriptional regulator with XRE-family HTH domain